MQRKALGKGIGALFTVPTGKEGYPEGRSGEMIEVALERIHPNPYQPRMNFDEGELSELADSLKEKGVIQPLLVRSNGSDYELIAGERRLRAAQRAGLKRVPVVVREVSGKELLELALVENLQRRDLNPIEAARAYRQLVEEFGLTQEEVAKRVGKERSSVTNSLRLLALPEVVQRELISERLSYGHAKVLLSVKDAVTIQRMAQLVIQKGLSVRQTEELLQPKKKRYLTQGLKKGRDTELIELEEKLVHHLGTKVRVEGQPTRGRIVIDYFSAEELDRLLETLLS
jgi:ParB family chromosome partitioning protein